MGALLIPMARHGPRLGPNRIIACAITTSSIIPRDRDSPSRSKPSLFAKPLSVPLYRTIQGRHTGRFSWAHANGPNSTSTDVTFSGFFFFFLFIWEFRDLAMGKGALMEHGWAFFSWVVTADYGNIFACVNLGMMLSPAGSFLKANGHALVAHPIHAKLVLGRSRHSP